MRCRHCFVGDLLDTSQDMPRTLLEESSTKRRISGQQELVYLGGEPSLYPYLGQAIRAVRTQGIE